MGRCSICQAWNSIEEIKVVESNNGSINGSVNSVETMNLSQIKSMDNQRLVSGHSEFDRVVGGGLIRDSITLIGGDPGVGKSTLLLSVACDVAMTNSTLYVSGEESLEQTVLRLQRMKKKDNGLQFIASNNIHSIINTLTKEKTQVAVIDSIQAMVDQDIGSQAGTVSQIRECTQKLTTYAKHHHCTILMIGHVTKDGMIAGPRVLEHLVDTVLQFEGDDQNQYRILRAIKNRFGSVNELGIFAMDEEGIKDVDKPSELFLNTHNQPVIGSVATAIKHGRRSLLVEMQTLVDQCYGEYPKRNGQGIDSTRIPMLLAVLSKHSSIQLSGNDVYINAVGGIKIIDLAVDLAIIGAIISAVKSMAYDLKTVVCGEVGLLGEVRAVSNIEERINTAQLHGFTTAIVPKINSNNIKHQSGIKIIGVSSIKEFLQLWS